VRTFLHKVAEPGWAEAPFEGIPKDWYCFRGVKILQHAADVPWPALQAPDDITIRLTGGLKLERNTYFAGFEPTLEVYSPNLVGTIQIDDEQLPVRLQGNVLQIPLAPYCKQQGYHTISVGTCVRGFITRGSHRPMLSATNLPPVAYWLRRELDQYQALREHAMHVQTSTIASGDIYISGAMIYGHPDDLPGPLPHTIFVPGGFKQYIVLGRRPGEVFKYAPPFQQSSTGIQSQSMLRLDVPFDPQWLIKISKKRYLSSIQPTASSPLAQSSADVGKLDVWCHWILRKWVPSGKHKKRWVDEHTDRVWEQYKTQAQATKVGR
jgi:hypothetical protein